ncbi:MAG: FlgD immunoglobulin-like domain containing protein [Armatimonadota bacterium]
MNFRNITAITAVFALSILCRAAIGADYYNVSNTPFATISNGPQNAVVVDVTNPNDTAEVDSAVAKAIAGKTRAAATGMSRQIAMLRKAGMIQPDVDPMLYTTVLVRSNGSFESPTRAEQTYGGGTITFTYSGWSAADETLLKSFVQIAYPILVQIYGSPARTITVQVINDTTQTEKDSLLGGVYITGSGVQPQIKLWRYSSNVSLERSLLHMMIHAFHDTVAFSYDAWEEGFTRAAAVVAGEEIDKKIAQDTSSNLKQMDFVGRSLGDAFYYLMTNYEMLNQPALSNNKFLTSWTDSLQGGDMFGGMIIPRLGMSSTAWLKVYTERLRTDGQSFFKLFNEEYYLQLSGSSGVAGNVPALKGIASSITSTVEGQSFDDWFSKQYIFDTSVSIGKKLYVFTFPPDTPDDPDTEGYSLPTVLVYYNTTSTGDETPLAGTVYPVYWDYIYTTDLFLSGQYETVDITNGEGSYEPTFYVGTLGGAQRIAIDYTLGTETTRVYFPAGLAGTSSSPNNFQGVVVGADTGTVVVKVDAEATGASTSVVKGAFGTSSMTSVLGFSKLNITYTQTGGTPITKTVNVGPGNYIAFLYADSASTTLVHTFTNGTKMISLPMTTYTQDQASALDNGSGSPVIPANSLLMARWNPLLSGDYKYEMYPKTPPFAPGRAYWAKFPSTVTVTVTGDVPDPAGSYRIGLSAGWNQIGTPFTSSISVSSLMVEKGNDDPVAFSTAWSTGLIGKTIWKYTPGTGYTAATSLDPWEGYWIKCNVSDGVVLTVSGPGRAASRAASTGASTGAGKSIVSSSDWAINLSAHSGDGDASGVTLGVAAGATDGFDNAFDSEAPPSYGNGVNITAKAAGAGTACAVDTRAAGASKVSWDMIVTPSEPNQDIVVKWGDISGAPKRCRLVLTDQSTGASRFMRTTSSYRFNSGDGSTRQFTVTADSSPSTRLMITNLLVGPTRGTSMSFSYNLTTAAQVKAEIKAPGGRLVRQLNSGQTTRSGINNMVWDRRDDSGETVPAGMYLLNLEAVTEDGEMVKNIRPVLIAR